MSIVQKVIKYLALAFAIFLSVNIFTGIFSVFDDVFDAFDFGDDTKITDMSDIKLEDKNAKVLNIDIHAAKLEIKAGEELKVESNNEDIAVEQNKNVLQIKEKDFDWFENVQSSKVVVYIPESMDFDKVYIATGAGEVIIDTLHTDVLDLDLGAGEVNINYLEVKQSAEIDGGAGQMTIEDGVIADLSFDMGVGEAEIKAQLLGDSDIDMGIGELLINIIGEKEDYTIEVDKGVGDFTVDGEKVHDEEEIGNGPHEIQLDGGVGEAEIIFN